MYIYQSPQILPDFSSSAHVSMCQSCLRPFTAPSQSSQTKASFMGWCNKGKFSFYSRYSSSNSCTSHLSAHRSTLINKLLREWRCQICFSTTHSRGYQFSPTKMRAPCLGESPNPVQRPFNVPSTNTS